MRRGISLKLLIIVSSLVISLVSFIFTIFIASTVYRHIRERESQLVSHELSRQVFDSMLQLMKKGWSRKDLEAFLLSTQRHDGAAPYKVSIFRSSVVERQFGRDPGDLPGDVVRRVLRTGAALEDNSGYLITSILPVKAEQDCLGCHSLASRGDVLGAVEVRQDIGIEISRANRSFLMLFLILSPLPLLMTFFLSRFITGRIHRSSQLLQAQVRNIAEVGDATGLIVEVPASGFIEIDDILKELQQLAEGIRKAAVDFALLRETDNYRTEYIQKLEDFASRLMTAEEELRESYTMSREIIENAPLGIVLVNEDGSVEYVNSAMVDLGGSKELQFKEVNLLELSSYREKGLDIAIRDVFNGTRFTSDEIEYSSFLGNETIVKKFTGIPFIENGKKRALLFVEDLTERKKAEKVLRQAKEDWENTFNSITDMITIHDRDYNILSANTAAVEILKLDLSGGNAPKCFECYHVGTIPPECPAGECLGAGCYSVSEIWEPHLNKFIEIRATPRLGEKKEITGMIHIGRDITERKKMEKELMHQALYDALTSLPNRALLFDRVKNLYEHRRREKDILFAVLFIDLDDFKKVNDSLGHLLGDELLVSTARRLSEIIRPGDTISRFGGDEFVMLLNSLGDPEPEVLLIVERIRKVLSSAFSLGGHEVFISASIGIALSGSAPENPEDLLRNADIAMYRAKDSGKAGFALFNDSMHAAVVDALTLESELRRAIQMDDLEVHFQPIFDIQSNSVAGFEALARWNHPSKGFIPPVKFIPIAESAGLIEELGLLVLGKACRLIKQINALYGGVQPLYVSVNLSVKQFNSELTRAVAAILDETGLASSCLRLEITEGTIMENIFSASSILHELRAMGLQVYLDDFGTGYSSLNYLHKFPVDALKIDPSFTKNIHTDRQSKEILKSILSLANNLEMKMIIEGVEDEDQLKSFRELNCRFIQGYLISKPLSAKDLFQYMRIKGIPTPSN